MSGQVKAGTVPVFNQKHFEENNYLAPVPVTSSYLPVKDRFVLHLPFNKAPVLQALLKGLSFDCEF